MGRIMVTKMTQFLRYIGIDYSGAETPDASLKGLRVYLAENGATPVEVPPSPSPRKYWTRRGLAEWLADRLAEDVPTLVGIEHGFSLPLRYFEVHRLPPDLPASGNRTAVQRRQATAAGRDLSPESLWTPSSRRVCDPPHVHHPCADVRSERAMGQPSGRPCHDGDDADTVCEVD